MIQVLLAALLWGFGGALAGRLMTGALEPGVLIPLRFFGSALVLLPVLWWRPPARAALPRLGTIGVAMAATLATYYGAIHASSVATALFLQYLAPVLLTVWAVARRESIAPRALAGVAVAVAGAYFLVVGPDGLVGGVWGVGLGLACAVFFATYSHLSMRAGAGPWTTLAVAMVVGSLLCIPFAPWAQIAALAPADWLAVLYVVTLGTVVPFGLFLWGVQVIPARVATLLAMLEPLSGSVFAAFIAFQPLAAGAIVGGLFILVGVWLNRPRDAGSGPLVRRRRRPAR